MKSIRIMLDEDDFAALVRGKVIRKDQDGQLIEIALADLGYLCMRKEIKAALLDTGYFLGDGKEQTKP